MRLNTAEVAPIPSVRVRTAIKVKPGCFHSIRAAKRRSWIIVPPSTHRFDTSNDQNDSRRRASTNGCRCPRSPQSPPANKKGKHYFRNYFALILLHLLPPAPRPPT